MTQLEEATMKIETIKMIDEYLSSDEIIDQQWVKTLMFVKQYLLRDTI